MQQTVAYQGCVLCLTGLLTMLTACWRWPSFSSSCPAPPAWWVSSAL